MYEDPSFGKERRLCGDLDERCVKSMAVHAFFFNGRWDIENRLTPSPCGGALDVGDK